MKELTPEQAREFWSEVAKALAVFLFLLPSLWAVFPRLTGPGVIFVGVAVLVCLLYVRDGRRRP